MDESLLKLLNFNTSDRFKLLYRGTRDGFAASTFHSKCDYTSNTLTIVESGSNIFGGFTSATWDGSGDYKSDSKAFLFSLKNSLNRPLLMKQKSSSYTYSIYASPSYGPTFGGGHDLHISSNSNLNTVSYSNLDSYQFDLYNSGSSESKSFLAGSYNFKVDEIEVFHKN